MKRRGVSVEIALGVVVVAALLAALVFPLRVPAVAAVPVRAGSEQPASASGAATATSSEPEAAAVAALFGVWQRQAAPTSAPPPQAATFLHYLAFAVESNGRTDYFFKDDQSGRVVMLAVGAANGGWRLISASGGSFLLDRGGTRYLVKAGSR